MNRYKGTIKTSTGTREIEVRANSFQQAESLMEQQGRLLYRAKCIPG